MRRFLIVIVLLMLSTKAIAVDEHSYQGLSKFGWQGVNAANKQVLICEISHWLVCQQQLDPTALAQLDFGREFAQHTLGRQEAMVLPIKDKRHAGVILLAPSLAQALDNNGVVRQMSINVAGQYYSLALDHQAQLTLWHELGHLENIALQGSVLPRALSAYEHEWLADAYTLWRSVHETGNLDLAWQQYHRRNMALINDVANLSHWSAPQLMTLLSGDAKSALLDFEQYSDFIASFYPKLMQFDEQTLAEYSSLVQRTFGTGAVQALPQYMFWRQKNLALWLRPTLSKLMGKAQGELWLKTQFSALQ